MITSQRLIIILVMFNILTGIVTQIYNNPTTSSIENSQVITEADSINEKVIIANNDDSKYGGITSENLVSEQSIGNPISWGNILLNIFTKGFNPISVMPTTSDTVIEQIAISILILIKSLLYIILLIEIYFIFKNKKTN